MPNKIHWLIPYHSHDEPSKSNLASVRLRLAVAIKLLKSEKWSISWGKDVSNNPDFLIIGKITPQQLINSNDWLGEIEILKRRGTKIVLDYTDHHLGHQSPMTAIYQRVISMVDVCITPSTQLSSLIKNYFSGQVFVVPDAIEVDITPPKFKELNSTLTALWFGHASNIEYLIKFLDDWDINSQLINLIVLSNINGLEIFSQYNFKTRANIKVALYEWSLQTMISASKVSDICLIPSNFGDMRKQGASSNRLITSLALGLPTAAELLPSYKEFLSYFVDIRSNELVSLISNPNDFRSMVYEAQQYIVPEFKADNIAKNWLKLFSELNN